MIAPAAGQRYWLGGSPPEISRLLAQAEFLGPDAAGAAIVLGGKIVCPVIGRRARLAA